ncbi:DsbA family protein [Candidatus Daviesbacteria bacterium]|nr:DsbA family protein [Candidatus Daviesbacteria bacterium]
MNKSQNFLSTPLAIIIGSILISVSILISGGVIKVKNFKGSSNTTAQQTQIETTDDNTLGETTDNSKPVKVALDDDPVLGDKNAPITLVEFSDYECPFCKRHFDETYPQLIKNYIDTGKVKLVYRDYPLSFHDPMATFEAIAADCSKEQGGDEAYFKFHDEIFKRTKSNGNGLSKDDVYKISDDLGLNTANLKACTEAEKYKEEVKKDLDYGSTIGVSGTPTFFIGKSAADGTVEGKPIVGAQPYSVFQSEIDSFLK